MAKVTDPARSAGEKRFYTLNSTQSAIWVLFDENLFKKIWQRRREKILERGIPVPPLTTEGAGTSHLTLNQTLR